ncbi:MAG: thioredoxin family protein [Rhodocyclaceae bacterium]|nr:MAG: thioredoxin family protein [Rhodocyclaceae bacterium]TND03308.1 MAG: thioredoxin family protein [Rhodocyclaceae bacterium]
MKSCSTRFPAPMTERRRFLAALALLALAPPIRAQHAGTSPAGMSPLPTVPPAPTLRLPDMDGKLVDLAAYRGKVVLVNFWATWCPPCRKEFPSLARVRKLFKPADFEVLAVNVGEDPDTVFSFAGSPDFPVLFDRDSQAMERWPVRGLPTTLVVDRQGRLALRAVGGREFDNPAITAQLKTLLK